MRAVGIAAVCILGLGSMAPAQTGPPIRVTFFGTGAGPNPNAERAGPSALVEAGGERLFIDAGRSVVQRMTQAKISPRTITRLFLTHLHSDHTVGLPDLWLSGWWVFRDAPLEVRGPSGTRAMTEHLQEAFAADVDVRTGPPERLRRDTAALVGIDVDEGVVYQTHGVVVTAIKVDHGPVNTYGYRIDFAGHSVVFSGDDRKSDNLIAKAQNVDVLVHPMSGFTAEELKEEGRVGDRRRAALQLLASPEDAAIVFTRSRCKVAVLAHTGRDEASLARVRAGFSGRLEVADDLTQIDIADEIVVRVLPR